MKKQSIYFLVIIILLVQTSCQQNNEEEDFFNNQITLLENNPRLYLSNLHNSFLNFFKKNGSVIVNANGLMYLCRYNQLSHWQE